MDRSALMVDGAQLGGFTIDGDVGGFVEGAEEAGRAVGGGGELVYHRSDSSYDPINFTVARKQGN